ncbi:MAG: ATP-binding cassette domain-containing protein, partial [Lachnospiraceae bacterium]|nr:ATP-binding cassette domain-containing protein [Lachnospiraceae bacterium]
MIETKKLEKHFKDLYVLKGIDQKIEKGEKVVIVGPSGSGKSTFLRCLNFLEVPTGGEVWFEGINLTDASVNIDKHR